jgi:coenzyme F420-dependent glucose-6-phosphate dehydrogenase
MALVGYHASHEQFAPEALLTLAQRAEGAGFAAAMCSDHFHPWSATQGHSGHAWTWLGAAMASTSLPFGVVNAPVGRYHPAIIAQAAATLARMFPGRFWMAVGSGEALNEAITGAHWPAKEQRNARLREAVEVMRALWRGEEVSHEGEFTVQRARLYSLPAQPPKLYVAALSEDTARWGAQWADGLITVSMPGDEVRRIVEAFREGGGEGKPMALQVKLSWDADEPAALAGAHAQWKTNVFDGEVSEVLRTPEQYEAAAKFVRPEDVARMVRVSSDLARQEAWLREDLALGFDALYLHNVNTRQDAFVDAVGPLAKTLSA